MHYQTTELLTHLLHVVTKPFVAGRLSIRKCAHSKYAIITSQGACRLEIISAHSKYAIVTLKNFSTDALSHIKIPKLSTAFLNHTISLLSLILNYHHRHPPEDLQSITAEQKVKNYYITNNSQSSYPSVTA